MEAPLVLNYEIDHRKAGLSVRKRRVSLGISVLDLADALGLKKSYMSDLERGRRNWTDKRFKEAHRAIHKLSRKK
jgi:transcriptional regulator with XRE-family HTH domain